MGDNLIFLFCSGQPLYNVLPILLADRTTCKNIVWATDTYEQYGMFYEPQMQMLPEFVLNLTMKGILLPRIQKTKEQQKTRTKAKAEVFTPSWVCNMMNNFLDEDWFGRKGVFNTENDDHTWTTTTEKIDFKKAKTKKPEWQKYVDSRRIEITCGEAPYLVSRYDTTTGETLELENRIGLLDRKLRIVNENASDKSEWLKWAYRAYEATYGYEWQGDNLFFARVNLVQTFIDYYSDRFGTMPTEEMIEHIANIVSWNLWQMDGLKDAAPFGIPDDEEEQLSIFETEKNEIKPVYCKVRDWRSKKVLEFREMKGENT